MGYGLALASAFTSTFGLETYQSKHSVIVRVIIGRVTVTSPVMVRVVAYSISAIAPFLLHMPRSYLSDGVGVGAVDDDGGLGAVGDKVGDNLDGDGGRGNSNSAGFFRPDGGVQGDITLRSSRVGDEGSRSNDRETHFDCSGSFRSIKIGREGI